jgi:hypothetical protein
MRQNAVAHFAGCDRCRQILSNAIAENIENETVHAAQIELSPTPISWYRRLFAFPNLAYTLGALVVVFAGIIGFTVLQTIKNSQNAEVSQVSERQLNGKGMSSDGDAVIIETANSNMATSSSSMSNAAMSNSAAPLSPNAAQPINALTANASTNSAARISGANSMSNSPAATNKSGVSADAPAKDEKQSEPSVTSKSVSELPLNGRSVSEFSLQKTENEKKEDKNKSENEETIKVNTPQPKSKKPADSADQTTSADAVSAPQSGLFSVTAGRRNVRKSDDKSVETKKVGERIFERKNDVWIDSTYKNQATVNVARGTKDYKKLDSGLRTIAENFGGTTIIVWKDKAYRIQ